MDPEAPAAGSRVFKLIFSLSCPWGLAWLLGFVLERGLEVTLPRVLGLSEQVVFFGLLALLYLIVFAVVWPGRGWLWLPEAMPVRDALWSTALWAVAGYVIAIPICYLIALLMTRGNTRGEAGILVVLFSIWMPLWWAVPIGTIFACRRERRRQRPAPATTGPDASW